jgi:hypothetical protein
VEFATSFGFLVGEEDSSQFVLLIVHPSIVAGAKESVVTLEIGMYVEVHRTPRLRSQDK